MNMTRKQFEMIAEVISSLNVDTEKRAEIAIAFSDALASTNVRFNTTTFTVACISGGGFITSHLSIISNLSYSEPRAGDGDDTIGYTVIDRARLTGLALTDVERVYEVDAEFYSRRGHHFGSRIVFDADGFLYFTIGDRGQRPLAQSVETPNGKVHRLHDDGRIPADNPFAEQPGAITSIWSYGHRNPQGMAVHPTTGEIYTTEHGPRGGDELNRIQKGVNYGWPAITYGINYNGTPITEAMTADGMEQPILFWNPSIAPCGIDFYDGDQFPKWKNHLLVTALAFQQLRRVHIEHGRVIHQEIIFEPGSRFRDVETGPDGLIYVALEEPGRIVRLSPAD